MDKTIKKNPKATVLMPVYNGKKYLKDAIKSILNQTFSDFEFLIINDGSTDNTKEIVKSFRDKRIIYIENNENLKLIKTLNKGFDLANGKYIIRMDADDISLPNRIKKQIEFMDKNSEIGISGTWAKTFGNNNQTILKKYIKSNDIQANLLFESAFIHPTVIIRKNIIKKYNLYYNENYLHSEDRELWARASNFIKLANLNKILLFYRIHQNSISRTYSDIQKKSASKTILNQLKKIGLNPDANELAIHRAIKKPKNNTAKKFITEIKNYYTQIIQANKKRKIYNEKSLLKILSKKYFNICYNLSNDGFLAWKKYWQSSFAKNKYHTNLEIIKFFIRCFLKKSP